MDRRQVISGVRECRLLHDDVFAGRQRLQREIQVELRRDGDDDRIDCRIRNRRAVVWIGPGPAEPARVGLGAGPVAAGVAAHDVAPERRQDSTVYASDEPTAQEGYAERFGHSETAPVYI